MKLAAVLEAAAAELAAVGVPSPQNDAEVIMAHALGISRGSLLAKVFKGDDLSGDPLRQFAQMIDRRMSREPLQHIVGLAPFLDFELKVGPGVFIPRPETEMLTEMALAELGTAAQPLVVDVGTGSGAAGHRRQLADAERHHRRARRRGQYRKRCGPAGRVRHHGRSVHDRRPRSRQTDHRHSERRLRGHEGP